jgi:hypothetical protein
LHALTAAKPQRAEGRGGGQSAIVRKARALKRHDDRGDLARVQRDQSAFGPFAKLQLRWLASAVGGCYARGSESCVAVEIEHAPLGVCVMTIITTEWTTTASKHPGVPEAATTT